MLNKIVSSVLCWVHYAVIIIHKNFLKQNGFGFFFGRPKKWFHKYKLKRMPKYKLNQLQHIVLCSFFSAGQILFDFCFRVEKVYFHSICVFHEEKKHFIKHDLVSEQR